MKIFKFLDEKPKAFLDERTKKKIIWFRLQKSKSLRKSPHIGHGNKTTPSNVDKTTV